MKLNFTFNIRQLFPLLGLVMLLNFQISQAQTGLTVKTLQITRSCKDDGTALLSVTGGVPPYNAYWIVYGQSPVGGSMDTVATGLSVNNLKPGYYQVKITDSSTPNPISAFHTVWIEGAFNIRPSISAATCSNANGKIVVTIFDTSSSRKGPYSYEWSNGINNLNSPEMRDSIVNLIAGSYTIKVTDGNGCFVRGGGGVSGTTNPEGFLVWSNSPITTAQSATPSNCFDGTAKVTPANGTAPYTYLWNTIPVQSGQTATGLSPGIAEVTVTDAVGCSRRVFISVPAGPNSLQANSSIVPETCDQSNGAVNLTVSGGQAPYSYTWSNGASTEDINGLASGYYNVQITDNKGCKIKIFKFVAKTSPMQVDVTGTAPGCNLSDGQLLSSVTGGAAPYVYLWNNGTSTNANYTNVPKGYYYLQVTDANGCKGSDYLNLKEPESCKAQIRGRIFNDLNGNCQLDNGEGGLANVIISATPGAHYASTDQDGFYSLSVETGTYDVKANVPSFWNQECPSGPATIQVNANNPGSVYGGNNFYLVPDSVFNDLQVFVSSGPARPGFNMTWYITVRNAGTTTLTPTLEFTHDPIVNYISSNPAAGNYNAGAKKLTWNVPAMTPQSNRSYFVITKLPVNAMLGDSVRSNAKTMITGNDVNPTDNEDFYARLITGSYDPNDKLVRPQGLGDQGNIEWGDSLLTYRIRFQNTGTDTAFTVVVRDTLDQDLNIPSFKLKGTSHQVAYTLSGEGMLEFTFDNILLPDSNINEPLSHGYIEYTIKRRSDVAMGTKFTNAASIYFDFNPPIHTNTTLNTLYEGTVSTGMVDPLALSIWPNPSVAGSRLTFMLPEPAPAELQIHDLQGRLVYQQQLGIIGTNLQQIELNSPQSDAAGGVYLVTVKTPDFRMSRTWIVQP